MATKTFNSRIQVKFDTFANWTANNPILLSGEIAIVVVPVNSGAVTQEPAVLIKVGDGVSTFNALSFTSAKAADVYDWAKSSTKPVYNANEIANLEDYISGKIQDTNTHYQIVKVDDSNYKLQARDVGGEWTDVPGSTISIPEFDAAAINQRIDSVESSVEAVEVSIGVVAEGKTIVQMIEDAKTSVDDDILALTNRVSAAEGSINTLVGSDTGKSVRAIAAEELAAKLIPGDAKEALDTLEEIAAWIQAHPDDAAAINASITELQNLIGTLPEDATSTNVVGYIKEYCDAAIAAIKIGDYAKVADLSAAVVRIATLESTVANLGDSIDALDSSLSAVAKDGNINSLIQTENDYVIFNCGTSSLVI